MWPLIRVWSPDGHQVRLRRSVASVESWSNAHVCGGTVCASAMSPKEGKGAANDFLGCTDVPQLGLLVSSLAHWDAQGQYRFCDSTVTVLTAPIALIESPQWDGLTKSASMSLYFMYNEIVSSELTVGVVFPWGDSACKESTATGECFALLSIVTERKQQEEKWLKYRWCGIDHTTPATNQCSAGNPRTMPRKSLDMFSKNIIARFSRYAQVCQPTEAYCYHAEKMVSGLRFYMIIFFLCFNVKLWWYFVKSSISCNSVISFFSIYFLKSWVCAVCKIQWLLLRCLPDIGIKFHSYW